MFTGLIESVATVVALEIAGEQATLILKIDFSKGHLKISGVW